MRFGLWYAAVGPFAIAPTAVRLARAAEAAGFESLWTGDHVVVPAEYSSIYPYSDTGRMASDRAIPMGEPLTWAAHITGATTDITCASGVLVLPQREPVLLAKQAATVAVLSEGRFILGVGAGWLREEFEMLGADFDARGRNLDEFVAAMRELWANDVADFDGRAVNFHGAQLAQRPPDGRVPIVVGGDTEHAARRAGRLGDGYFPAKGDPERVAHLFDLARKTADTAGRDPDALELTVCDPSLWNPEDAPAAIERWRGLGVDRLVVTPNSFAPDKLIDNIAAFGEEVIDRVDH